MRACLAVLLLILSTTAHASGEVGVVVTGEPTMQPQLAAQLESWLRSHGHTLVASPLPPEAVNTLIDCFVIEDESCARGVVEKRAKPDTVVFARVEVADNAESGMRDVTITAYWFDKGHEAVAERRFCERCTDQTLRNTADDLMSALAGAGHKDVGHLRCASNPAGAKVIVDGQPVGVTPMDYALAPGEHKITVLHERHREEVRSVTIRKGETTPLDVKLDLIDGAPRSHLVPLVAVIGGGALLATGVLVYRLAEPDTGASPTYHDDRNHTLGLGLGVAGLAAIGVGTYLFLSAGAATDSTPTVAVTPHGAYVGWAQTF